MAKHTDSSILGGFSGLVGTVVLYSYRNIPVMRERPRKRDKTKDSVKQLRQQEIFEYVSLFLLKAKRIIDRGYQSNGKSNWTPLTFATSWHLKNALVMADDGVHLLLEELKLSWPKQVTQKLWKPEIKAEPGSKISITWELNPFPQSYTSLDDEVTIAIYMKGSNAFRSSDVILREQCKYEFNLPWVKEEDELYVYAFARSSDGKRVSDTAYLGNMSIIK